ncbi:hypothetical protein ACFFVF_07280 [Flavobacterium jumunjinense]|uniref:Collagen triple helix repeat-containing protein n=1 Tax=Flavobacterium jumunjinense TaxID=998845 RepID=A0ABV5GLR3_9FLAO|nr:MULTISPECIES: hypothetical protein [Flavobacterium]
MKNRILLFAFLLIGMVTYSQSPDGFTYQAVIRDAGDAIVTSSPIGMKISILQTSASGTAVYEETQTPTSNANGLVTLTVGSGTVVSGSLATIDWSAGPYFIKTETDPTGGTSYSISGTSQMMSVPFALYAANSTPGPQGPAGLDGADGLDGATGPMGPQGPAGLDGADGLDGATGPQGPQGPAGLDGADGLDGATGPMGPQGPAGLDGADGLDGATGPQGPQGPAGLDGADGLDGATGPMGPQGPAGLDGADGLDGATGPQGPAGLDGADGLDGATGPMGPQGPAGLDGADGLDGATGPQGPQGPAGTYTAGTGIDITGSVISATGSGAMPEYAYANIGNASVLGAQTLTAVAPAGTYVNGVVMNGSSITLHANKMYEVSVAFYIYNATGGHTFRLKDATNNQYLATELYFGQGGSDISYNISTTSCLIKPTTDINLELEKTQGTDVNLIGKIIVKEIK